jgi:hypothetical protein
MEPGHQREFSERVGTLDELRSITLDTVYFTATLNLLDADGTLHQTREYPAGAFAVPQGCTGTACGGNGGTSVLEAWNSNLELEAVFEVGTEDLWATVRATNVGQDTLRGNTGAYCAWWMAAYENPSRQGVALWRQETAETPRVCFQALLELNIPPGETFEFRSSRVGKLAELRAVASGRTLYFGAALRFDAENDTYIWTREFPAGSYTPQ